VRLVISLVSVFCVVMCGAALRAADNAPVTRGISQASSVDEVLDGLQAAGDNLKDFTATARMSDINNATGEGTTHVGDVAFQKKPAGDARFKIDFNREIVGDKAFPRSHVYVLDNGWLIERDQDHGQKSEVRRQVVKPGEKVELLKLGSGPFPLPIGQKKEDVKNLFDVKKLDPVKDDPAGTIHLMLTPKPKTEYAKKFQSVEVWVDPATSMPKRIDTTDVTGNSSKSTELQDMKINPGVGDKDFALPSIEGQGWNQVEEPLKN